ncbi:MAG: VOC family protein [Acidobacteriota bacterium]|nr:VOC family protein [Acidobacteriota bacterium]
MTNRSVPTDTMLSHLAYRSVVEACDWLERVFGFVELYRYGQPVSGVQMHRGGAHIMLTSSQLNLESPAEAGCRTQMLTILVADVAAHFAQSRREGAKIWEELHETVYGEMQYGAEDSEGHRWIFSQHVRDLSPEQWGAVSRCC